MAERRTPIMIFLLTGGVITAVSMSFVVSRISRALASGFNMQDGMDELAKKQAGESRKELAMAKNDSEKIFPMATIAKYDFNHGNVSEAQLYAKEILSFAAKMPKVDGEYGVAIHDGNMVLGRIAFKSHDTQGAKQYLLKAGLTPGAPTLDSFGPNMSLANDLLGVGEREAVIQYFRECHRFWSYQSNKLDTWESDVKAGSTPDFGANLDY